MMKLLFRSYKKFLFEALLYVLKRKFTLGMTECSRQRNMFSS